MTFIVVSPAPAALKPLAMALAVAVSFSAFAQTNPETVLAPVIVTATRSPQVAMDVLPDNVIITPEEIAQSGQTSLIELLQRQRGVEIVRNGGPGTSSQVLIRGASNAESIVLIDGVRIGSSTLGGATWATIPLSQIDHIEIVYGPLSSMYGADAIGGVIQIFTKKGEGPPNISVSAGYGSYGTRMVDASVFGAANTSGDHRLSYAFNTAHEDAQGFSSTKPGNFSYNPDKDGYSKDSASGQFSLEVEKGHEVGLLFLQSRLNAQYDSGASTYDTRTLQKLENVALYSKNRFLPDWNSYLKIAQSADKSGTDSSAAASGKSQINTTQIESSWQNDVMIGSDVLQLLVGQRKEKVDSTSTPALTGERITNSAAVSYQLKRDAHLAIATIRNDDSSQYGSHKTESVGYGYHITNALRASANFGTSFRAPTFNELYFPSFGVPTNKPEQGKNAEVGLYYQDGTSQASIVYYHNHMTDLLVTAAVCPVSPGTHPFGCAYNVDNALLTGVTLNANKQLGNFSLRGSLDVQDPKDETTDKVLARRARQHASLGLDYGAGPAKVGAEVVLSGKRFDDVANQNTLGGYGLLNLYADYNFDANWTLFGRWNNVTNKNYELARNYATSGSSLFVGVRYAMK